MNTRRLIAIFENSIKEYTQQRVADLINSNIINPQNYDANTGLDQWLGLNDLIFVEELYTGRSIFPTPDLIIRCLNYIKQTELREYGEFLSFQDQEDTFNIEQIFRTTALLLVEFEIFDIFKNWVIECFSRTRTTTTATQEYAAEEDEDEIIFERQ
jgi:hypothetical protein